MKKNIIVLCNSSSGFYRLRKELIAALCQQYHMIVVAPNTGFVAEMETMGCEYIEARYERYGTNPAKEFQLIEYYYKLIKQYRPITVLTYAIKPNIYGGIAARLTKTPYIVNITGLGTAVEYRSKIQWITINLYKISLKHASMVFFQNNENLTFMKEKHMLGKSNFSIIPGSGVNLSQYQLKEYPNEGTIDFIFVGRVIKEKGIEEYLAAAQHFAERQDVIFHIFGNSRKEYSALIQQLHEQKIINYHGFVNGLDEMKEVYKMCSCIIHPSFYPEGLSNVLLEAAATGRPIIATDRSGCREVVEDGINGFLVKQRDIPDLIDKIEKFIGLSWDERKQMGIAGRVKVEQEFDRNIVVERYLEEVKRAGL